MIRNFITGSVFSFEEDILSGSIYYSYHIVEILDSRDSHSLYSDLSICVKRNPLNLFRITIYSTYLLLPDCKALEYDIYKDLGLLHGPQPIKEPNVSVSVIVFPISAFAVGVASQLIKGKNIQEALFTSLDCVLHSMDPTALRSHPIQVENNENQVNPNPRNPNQNGWLGTLILISMVPIVVKTTFDFIGLFTNRHKRNLIGNNSIAQISSPAKDPSFSFPFIFDPISFTLGMALAFTSKFILSAVINLIYEEVNNRKDKRGKWERQ